MATSFRLSVFSFLMLSGMAFPAIAAEPLLMEAPRFTAAQSCMSASCHGGGVGKDQAGIWEKKDPHSRANAVLSTTRSARIGEALGIDEPAKSARCTVCHSPLGSLPAERLVKNVVPDKGVSCETCHGPAEHYLRFHTRTDVTHEQRVSSGLRELTSLYGRAGTCVACHQNLDAELVKTGHHPEMLFELDRQMNAQPPHYKDAGTWIGPKAWATGQGVALREMSWKLTKKSDDSLVPRWKALVWLLRKTEFSSKGFSDNADYASIQFAADKIARAASRSVWTKEKSAKQLRDFVTLSPSFRDGNVDPADQRRRAEILVLGIDRLWEALKKEGQMKSDTFDAGLKVLTELGKEQESFEPPKFAAALEQLEVAMELWPTP